MPVWSMVPDHDPHKHPHHLPHIGMRKVKSILAVFVGFCFWQLLRLFLPGLENHPIFVYIYGMIEIRETSDKTKDYGRMRIMATFTAIGVGLPVMFLTVMVLSAAARKAPLLLMAWPPAPSMVRTAPEVSATPLS